MDEQDINGMGQQEDYMETVDNFQQERFTFLFDEELKFKARKDLTIRPEDYKKMTKLNREALISFLQSLLDGHFKPQSQMPSNFPVNGVAKFEVGKVSDEEIEENFKIVLSELKNGELLNADIVAHLEYFHNTLSFGHKNHPNHENPFNCVENYPALSYKASGKESLASIDESQTEEESEIDPLVDT